METWTKTCGLPLLFNFEPHPNSTVSSGDVAKWAVGLFPGALGAEVAAAAQEAWASAGAAGKEVSPGS